MQGNDLTSTTAFAITEVLLVGTILFYATTLPETFLLQREREPLSLNTGLHSKHV